MKIIRQDKPNFIIDLAEANTGDYALEDILVLYDETCKSITMPPQETIKGNPNVYFQCVSKAVFSWDLIFSGGDYLPCSVVADPTGKFTIANNTQNSAAQDFKVFIIKPLAGGAWWGAGAAN